MASNHTFTFQWRIENFSYVTVNTKEFVTSPTIRVFDPNGCTNWVIKVGQYNTGYLFVWLMNDDEADIVCDWEFSFLDDNEAAIFSKRVTSYNFISTPTNDIPPGPIREEVFETKKSEYLPNDTLTLRIRLWLSDEQTPLENGYCYARTVVGRDKLCIMWNIDEFSILGLHEKATKNINFAYSDINCTIALSIVGPSVESSLVRLTLETDNDIHLSCRISVLDIEKKSVKFVKKYYRFDRRCCQLVSVLPTFLTRQEILSNSTRWLDNDVLSLLLEFEANVYVPVGVIYTNRADMRIRHPKISNPTPSEIVVPTIKVEDILITPQEKEDPVRVMMKDFLSLYQDGKLCDFEFRCKDSSFPVHKAVLSARSPVFRALLSSNIENKLTFHYDPELDGKTINMMLVFMYGGTFNPDLTSECAEMLYDAAAKYQVQSLKEQCFSILKSGISMSKAFDFLVLFEKHGDDALKSFVIEFFCENEQEFLSSPKWEEFLRQNMKLASSILQELLTLMASKKKRLGGVRSQAQ